ncbi:hypothetical protein J23TS9_47940 [Paenibacillus sp. J23TS9]|uniref:hypothetical protein n=1 Tax=Paenibacillus sp. J23TS9 TaxID=2807193 RepID=UPI001B0FE836|nr:hypothetical protein [Paenibacillus sp. J23TS9]GIP29664.1 hypothetical protein J23TS9_47940 [Paenibacillus sp. J23TS9]
MNTQVWSDFLQQNWLVIVIALIVLFVVLNLVKTMVKWALVIIIIVAVVVYSGVSLEKIKDVVNDVKTEAVDNLKSEATNVMMKEAKEAKYTSDAAGNFTITTPNLEMKGQKGKDKVDVSLRGVSLGQWKISDTVQSFIAESKNNSNVTSGK